MGLRMTTARLQFRIARRQWPRLPHTVEPPLLRQNLNSGQLDDMPLTQNQYHSVLALKTQLRPGRPACIPEDVWKGVLILPNKSRHIRYKISGSRGDRFF